MKILKVPLSVKNIKELKKKLTSFTKDIKKVKTEIVDELADIAEKEVRTNYSISPYKDVEGETTIKKTKITGGKKVYARGREVIYREFGTGTEGSLSPHPTKERYGLKPYNSGKTIRIAGNDIPVETGIQPGDLYWTYQKDGKWHYTKGVPSGKEVYHASKKTRNSIKEISRKRVGEKISKL